VVMPVHHAPFEVSLAKTRIQRWIGRSFFLHNSEGLLSELFSVNFWLGPTFGRVGFTVWRCSRPLFHNAFGVDGHIDGIFAAASDVRETFRQVAGTAPGQANSQLRPVFGPDELQINILAAMMKFVCICRSPHCHDLRFWTPQFLHQKPKSFVSWKVQFACYACPLGLAALQQLQDSGMVKPGNVRHRCGSQFSRTASAVRHMIHAMAMDKDQRSSDMTSMSGSAASFEGNCSPVMPNRQNRTYAVGKMVGKAAAVSY
jgi:hypothetical protein